MLASPQVFALIRNNTNFKLKNPNHLAQVVRILFFNLKVTTAGILLCNVSIMCECDVLRKNINKYNT